MSFPSPPSVPPGGYGPPGHRYGGLPQTGYMGLPPDPQAQAVQTAAQGRLKRLRLILVACVAGVFPVGGALAVVTIASEPSIATIGLALEAGATMAARGPSPVAGIAASPATTRKCVIWARKS